MATNASNRFESDVSDDQTTLNTYAQFATERAATDAATCENSTEHCAGVDGLTFVEGDDYPQFDARFVCFDCYMDESEGTQ